MITTAAAQTVIRAATTAGVQVTVTLADGTQRSGTARWLTPGDLTSRQVMLFGAAPYPGPYTAYSAHTVTAGLSVSGTVNEFDPTTDLRTDIVSLDTITAITATAANSPALVPGQTNGSDQTLGTRVVSGSTSPVTLPNGYGYSYGYGPALTARVPDPTWPYGTGLE